MANRWRNSGNEGRLYTSWQVDGETVETKGDYFLWAPKLLQMVTAAMKLKGVCYLDEKL